MFLGLIAFIIGPNLWSEQLNDVGRIDDLLLFRPIQTFHCQIKLIARHHLVSVSSLLIDSLIRKEIYWGKKETNSMYPCALTFIKFIAIRRYLVFDFEKGFIVKKEANSPSFVHTSIWNLLYCETQPPASIFVSNCIFVWFNKNFDIIYVQNIVVLDGLLLALDGMKEAFQYGG